MTDSQNLTSAIKSAVTQSRSISAFKSDAGEFVLLETLPKARSDRSDYPNLRLSFYDSERNYVSSMVRDAKPLGAWLARVSLKKTLAQYVLLDVEKEHFTRPNMLPAHDQRFRNFLYANDVGTD